jgi:hypothetical protein
MRLARPLHEAAVRRVAPENLLELCIESLLDSGCGNLTLTGPKL